jgi:hypothetical protein
MKLVKQFAYTVIGLFIAVSSLVLAAPASNPAGQASTAVPGEIAGTTYYAAIPMTITLDGNFADWNGIPYATVTDGPQSPANAQDNSMQFAAAADDQNLYLSIQVTDKNPVAGKHDVQYWNEDSVEIYINATGDLALTSYTPGVAQITIPALNMGRSVDRTVIDGINFENLHVRAVVVATDSGYAIEAAVPLVTDQWNIVPLNGAAIGFQIQVNSASQLDRDVKLSWSAHDKSTDLSYSNPSLFGQLVFTAIDSNFSQAALPTLTPTMEITAPPKAANFEVQGSTILDPQGHEFVAKGINVNGYQWVWQRKTVADTDLIVNCWKFNLVRVNSFLFTNESQYPQYDNNNDLDEIVNTFTQRGIVVVFEAHDRIGHYYKDGDLTTLVKWFTDLATRYKNNPYVWFDVMNEPGEQNALAETAWLTVHQAVVQAVRDVAKADNIIIAEGAFGGQDSGNWNDGLVADANSAILSYAPDILSFNGKIYDNIVFSIHTYDQWNFGDAKLADYFDRVQKKNLAMVVGEYGVQTNADTTAAFDSTLNTAVPRHIGRIAWHWDGSDGNKLTTANPGGGWQIDDCSNPTNLSYMGQKIWDDNHTP